MGHEETDTNPQESPGESVAASLGVEDSTPNEQILMMAGLQRAATKLLAERLYDLIPDKERQIFNHALEGNDLETMVSLLRDRFPDYDEMQAAAIEEARKNLLAKAARREAKLESDEPETD
jgi:hypothetical protein